MKSVFSLITFFLLTEVIFAQQIKCCIPLENGKDTAFWYKWSQGNAEKIGLSNLMETKDSLHFRFWTETQVIDICTNDYVSFSGFLTNYTKSINRDYNSKVPAKFYHKKIMLDSSMSKDIYTLFNNFSIFSIPNQRNIRGWDGGLDGETLLIEYSTNKEYSFKNYWTPSEFKNIKQAVIIDTLSKKINTLLKMNKRWSSFIGSLPKGCYESGGAMMVCTDIITKRK